jgi:hypothetical protein
MGAGVQALCTGWVCTTMNSQLEYPALRHVTVRIVSSDTIVFMPREAGTALRSCDCGRGMPVECGA